MIDSKKGQKLTSIFLSVFATVGLLQMAVSYKEFSNIFLYYLYGYLGIMISCLIGFYIKQEYSKKRNLFYIMRFIELHFIFILIILSAPSDISNVTNASMFIFITAITAVVKGDKGPLIILTFSLANYFISTILGLVLGYYTPDNFIVYIVDITTISLIGYSGHLIIRYYGKTFWKLEQDHIDAAKTNQVLNDSVAELSTLQEINKFSNSVLNLKDLINLINDMIIGVIGVNYCSIFLIEENSEKVYLEATNNPDKNNLQHIKMILFSKYLPLIKARGLTTIEENINNLKEYPTTNDRGIKNSLITTLQSHRNFLGIILIESCFDDVFEQRKKNMITTICNQVSIAIENAVIYDKIEKLANIDGLTQVYNRRYFNEVFLAEFSEANKNPVCVAMMDIDNFKKVNDTYGHLTGDKVLKSVSTTIKNTICASDSENYLVARYGGEEFVILFRNTNLETAYTMLEVVRKNIENSSVKDEEQTIRYTISIGVAEYPGTSSDVKEILRDADNALYKAKQSGKNKVVTANEL